MNNLHCMQIILCIFILKYLIIVITELTICIWIVSNESVINSKS